MVALAAFFIGDKHALETATIVHASPTQIANAMKRDNFYTQYRESTLIVNGTVSKVTTSNNSIIVGFKTNSTYSAACNLGSTSQKPHLGQNLTVLAVGARAERQTSGVLLQYCVIP